MGPAKGGLCQSPIFLCLSQVTKGERQTPQMAPGLSDIKGQVGLGRETGKVTDKKELDGTGWGENHDKFQA